MKGIIEAMKLGEPEQGQVHKTYIDRLTDRRRHPCIEADRQI